VEDEWEEPRYIEYLTWYPLCPACMEEQLTLRQLPDLGESHWYCKHCKTEWNIKDLLAAINMECT